jgi:hypothetical protein
MVGIFFVAIGVTVFIGSFATSIVDTRAYYVAATVLISIGTILLGISIIIKIRKFFDDDTTRDTTVSK